MPSFLVSWDRLGFRLLVFGGLALMWVLNGLLAGASWRDMVRAEFGGLIPWAFLAPVVLAINTRAREGAPGRGRYFAMHLGGMALVFVPYWFIQRAITFGWTWAFSGWDAVSVQALRPTLLNIVGGFLNVPFVYLVILLGAEAMTHAHARREEAAQAERLARQLSDARLSLLQRQLHPHFLFNALQAISTLLHRDPAAADRLLVRLAELLRVMLTDAAAETLPLRTELDLVRRYLDIEQVRFGNRLSVSWQVDDAALDLPVPSLVVLPLVENAIRHGLAPKVGPARLSVEARRDESSLVLIVEDDGMGAAVPLAPGLGIGNTRQRLEAIYGTDATLDVDTAPARGFRAAIRVPIAGGRR